jgi:hypothetical protein
MRTVTKYNKGDRVVATKNLSGGLFGESVDKGTEGVVVEAPIMGDAVVLFKVKGFLGDMRYARRCLIAKSSEDSPQLVRAEPNRSVLIGGSELPKGQCVRPRGYERALCGLQDGSPSLSKNARLRPVAELTSLSKDMTSMSRHAVVSIGAGWR